MAEIPGIQLQGWTSTQVISVSYYNGAASKDVFSNNFNDRLVSRLGDPVQESINPNMTLNQYCFD